jgi:hypothetical protein
LRLLFAMLALCLLSLPAAAICKRNNRIDYPFTPLSDGGSAQFWFGRINLASTALQPAGTLLAVRWPRPPRPPASAAIRCCGRVTWPMPGRSPKCFPPMAMTASAALPRSAQDGLPGFYRTWFPGVAIRLTHLRSGKVFSRYYQSARLENYDVDEARKKI